LEFWKYINVTCSDAGDAIKGQPQKFIGFGLNPKGETESEICKKLVDQYHKFQNPYLLHTNAEKYEKIERMISIGGEGVIREYNKNFPQAVKALGLNAMTAKDFNAELIYDLKEETDLEKISMDNVKKLLAKQ
jgi:hypothetical protein